MLRRLLKSCLLLVLVVLMGVASARAQTIRAYKTYIPFDFTVGDQSYEAGDYQINLRKVFLYENSVMYLTVENAKGAVSRATIATNNGNESKNNLANLIFYRFGENLETYVLKEIVAPELGFRIWSSKTATSVKITKNFRQKTETVAVLLTPKK